MHLGSEIHAASLACGRGPLFTMSYYIIIHHNDNFTVTCKSCYLVDSVCMGQCEVGYSPIIFLTELEFANWAIAESW